MKKQEIGKCLTDSEKFCPRCTEGKDLQPISVQTWEDKGTSFWGNKRYFNVRSATVPGYCEKCSSLLLKKRILSSVLLALPLWFLMGFALLGYIKFSIVMSVLYFGYLIKTMDYSWADKIIYGMDLELELGPRIKDMKPVDAFIKFPIGFLHSVGRFLLIPISDLVVMLAFVFFAGIIFSTVHSKNSKEESAGNIKMNDSFVKIVDVLKDKDEEKFFSILSKTPEVINETNDSGETILHYAVKTENEKIVSGIIDRGANLQAEDRKNRFTPLHWAVRDNCFIAAKTLISKKANVNSRGSSGLTPLHMAVLQRNPKFAELLLRNGADVNAKMSSGMTPLYFAKTKYYKELETLLRNFGAKD